MDRQPSPVIFARPASAGRRLRMQRLALTVGPVRAIVVLALAATVVALLLACAVWLVWGDGAPGAIVAAALLTALTITPLVAWPLMRLVIELEAKRAQLDVLATRDELTGVYNRRHFLVLTEREWARCRRYEMGAAMLMIDVDRFKDVNEQHGHLAGDLMLREIARAATETLRQPDLCGRFGGEEFIVFLPHADPLGAIDAAERIRDCVARLVLEWRGAAVRTTVSVGVAALDAAHESLGVLIQDADQALHAAKEAGRNCVRTLPPQPRRSGEVRPVELR
jgi:diguanylate cyclase (GGDEF)-like protein